MKTASALMHGIQNTKVNTCTWTYDGGGPLRQGCKAVWIEEPYYGHGCNTDMDVIRWSARHSCRSHLDGIFKFPGTLIKSSPNSQFVPRIASPTPIAVSSPTPVPVAPTQLITPLRYLRSVKPEPAGGDERDVSTDTSCDTSSNECDISVTKGLSPLAGSCGAVSTAATEEMPKHVGERSAMK